MGWKSICQCCMDSQVQARPQAGAFTPASLLLRQRAGKQLLASGIQALDDLTGGYEPGVMYLFYSTEKSRLADAVLHHVIANAVRDDGEAVHLVCGNYRRSRTLLDTALLLDLLDAEGRNRDGILDRIHVIGSFSERHQVRAAELTEELVGRLGGVSAITVQQIAKMFTGKPLVPGVQRGDLGGMASRLKRLGLERGIPVIASCRDSGRGAPVPEPEAGGYLMHLANVIVYLRPTPGGAAAHLVKHFDRARIGRRVEFGGYGGLGRITSESMRTLLQEQMVRLREKFRNTLKDEERRSAFDALWPAWADEQGAMINSDIVSALDLLLLTAVVDNRREIKKLKRGRERRQDEG